MGARRPAPPPAGTTAALKGVALVPEPGEGVNSRAGEEEVSSGPVQAGWDNPVRRRAPPDRLASGPTGVAARVCKGVRVDRRAGHRRPDNAPELAGVATLPHSARPSIPAMELKLELSPSAVRRAGSNLLVTSSAAAAVISALAVFKAGVVSSAAAVAEAVSAVAVEAGVAEDDFLKSRRRKAGAASLSAALRIGLILIACLATDHSPFLQAAAAAPAVKQESFATPDDALKAVVDGLKSDNQSDLVKIFGPAIEPILNSGDPVADQNARERFIAATEADHRFDGSGDKMTLIIGKDGWPFPIPLKKVCSRWQFDTTAGKEEILNRRIGENELSTIQTMLAYVDAQSDYAELRRQRSGTPEYAQHILSSPGKMDGLYWPAQQGEPQSPLGPLIAAARAAGYRKSAKPEEPTPYHGYFYKLLTAQGPNAPGGAVDYIVNGRMIGGFGLVAWPARYGDSGIMTFMVNYDDVVYQKNLGPQTAKLAPAISRFDPDSSWQKVEP